MSGELTVTSSEELPRAKKKLLALRDRLQVFGGITSAGIIAIWLGVSLIVFGGQVGWTLVWTNFHPPELKVVSDAVVRGPGSSTYLVAILQNTSSNIANNVRAYVQVGSERLVEASSKIVPSVLRVAPMQEVVLVFSKMDVLSAAHFHFKIDVGYWTMPQMLKALPSITSTSSQSEFHVVAFNSSSFATQPVTLVGIAFGKKGNIQAMGSSEIRALRPSTAVKVNVPIKIGKASGEKTANFFEDN